MARHLDELVPILETSRETQHSVSAIPSIFSIPNQYVNFFLFLKLKINLTWKIWESVKTSK